MKDQTPDTKIIDDLILTFQPLAPLVAPLAPLVGPAGLVPVAGVVPTVIGPLNSLLSIPRNLISTVGYQLTTLG